MLFWGGLAFKFNEKFYEKNINLNKITDSFAP